VGLIPVSVTGRHPIYQVADKAKLAFDQLGFHLVDNGEKCEIEKAGISFATWKEPAEFFAWQSEPLKLRDGHTVLRPRLLPARLLKHGRRPPFRLLSFGRVYKKDKDFPLHHHLEGIAIEEGLSLDIWQKLWSTLAVKLFGEDTSASFEEVGEQSYRVSVQKADGKRPFELAYTGQTSTKTQDVCNSPVLPGWVFVIDVDQLALQYFSVTKLSEFYQNDVAFLSKFANNEPTYGESIVCTAVDALRKMGYQETCGAVLYSNDVYKKMNMIQEAWDKNNQGYPLVESLGNLTATRTVITPAIEEVMGFNYKHGQKALRVFEVGHIYLPRDQHILPKEHLAASMGAYGPGVTIESFAQEVIAFLAAMGIDKPKFVPTGMASAYKWNECQVIMSNDDDYLQSNFGQIHRTAARNHGIGVAAYMANFELKALEDAVNDSK
jgi:hypothetical protein